MSVAVIDRVMRLACALAPLLLMNCLVTDTIEPPDTTNRPPSVVSAPDAVYPLDQVIRINRDALDVPTELDLDVIVRDADVDQNLQVQVFVDSTFVEQASNNEITATGTYERSISLRVTVDLLGDVGCHKIEMRVSTRFQSFPDPRAPVEDGDLHQSVWWVALTSETEPTVDMGSCPR